MVRRGFFFLGVVRPILVTVFPEYFYALFLTAIVEVSIYILSYYGTGLTFDLGDRPFPSCRESLASLAQ